MGRLHLGCKVSQITSAGLFGGEEARLQEFPQGVVFSSAFILCGHPHRIL